MYTASDLTYAHVDSPCIGYPESKPQVPDSVFRARLENFCAILKRNHLDAAVIYADREHYANFRFFTNVDPRFEEALLVIHQDERAFMALGNECYSLAAIAAIPVEPVFCQMFSLPNQPMDSFVSIENVIKSCGIFNGMHIACIDWKLMTSRHGNDWCRMYSMPSYLIEAIAGIVGDPKCMINGTGLLIHPEDGLRRIAEPSAIAEFEYGAACASQSCIDMLNSVEPGMREHDLANLAQAHGQVLSCHEYVVGGDNPRRGLVSPSAYTLRSGDDVIISLGLEGGLTCRRAVLSRSGEGMAQDPEYYLESIVKPYMATVFNWYEMMKIGTRCEDIYSMVASSFPKDKYGWMLNPGHFIGYEEWMSSPFYKGSNTVIQSGMMFQMDIIPSDPAYVTPNAEDGLVIADAQLRAQLQQDYPEMYARIQMRRRFVEEQLGLKLSPEVLPLSNCFGEYRPFILARDKAITIR